MDAKEAKRILSTYRLGTWDDDDPAYTEALQVCAHDLELARWFEVQCRVDDTLRNRLQRPRLGHRITASGKGVRGHASHWNHRRCALARIAPWGLCHRLADEAQQHVAPGRSTRRTGQLRIELESTLAQIAHLLVVAGRVTRYLVHTPLWLER